MSTAKHKGQNDRNASNHVSMKKLSAITKSINKQTHNGNLKSNRDHLKHYKVKEIQDYINSSSSTKGNSLVLDSSKKASYMSSHIKRMLNASMNNSNPSISAHRNRYKAPVVNKQPIDITAGVLNLYNKNIASSRPIDFNNTQKINIGNHLDCLDLKFEHDMSNVKYCNYQTNLNQTSSHKFKPIITKNKENNKYSYISNKIFTKMENGTIVESTTAKTPSNTRKPIKNTVKPQMIHPPGEESNPYYKTQPKRIPEYEECNTSKWKNMTQKHIFDSDVLKISDISPLSTKN